MKHILITTTPTLNNANIIEESTLKSGFNC